jgi:hypothetical protein
MSASQKLEFLQEVRQHLMLTPEEYRLLVVHVLRAHRNGRVAQADGAMRHAA